MKRLVVDPNTLASGIAGLRSGAPPALLIRALQASDFEIVVCPEVLREVRKTLGKPYFKKRVSAEEARKAVARIERVAIEREDPKVVEEILRDPDDDYFVALAREAGAEAIVSGDKDLLDQRGARARRRSTLGRRASCWGWSEGASQTPGTSHSSGRGIGIPIASAIAKNERVRRCGDRVGEDEDAVGGDGREPGRRGDRRWR